MNSRGRFVLAHEALTQVTCTTLTEKRIIDIFARCMTKIKMRKGVQTLRIELKAHDLELDRLDSRIAKRAVEALLCGVAFMFTRRARWHRRLPEVERPGFERCFVPYAFKLLGNR